ncbi:hypothetical protein K502DRAFT_332064 [Neoconidiobolus thromboides FSU 785]|nr:hypothetical protein K502DRAFT_332064 [Neoconidiobolus thromboides FSU 785]
MTLHEENTAFELNTPKRSSSLNVRNDLPAPPVPEKDDHTSHNNRENQEARVTLHTIPEIDISLGEISCEPTFDNSFQSTVFPITPNTVTSSTPLSDDRWLHAPNGRPSISSGEDVDMVESAESDIFHEADSVITLDHFLRGL